MVREEQEEEEEEDDALRVPLPGVRQGYGRAAGEVCAGAAQVCRELLVLGVSHAHSSATGLSTPPQHPQGVENLWSWKTLPKPPVPAEREVKASIS